MCEVLDPRVEARRHRRVAWLWPYGPQQKVPCLGFRLPLETPKFDPHNRHKTAVNHFGSFVQISHKKHPEGCQKGVKDGDTAMDDERYSEDPSDRKKSDTYISSSEKIKKRLESLAKERDCAVEMWNLAKEAADAKREEAVKWASEAEKLAFRMDELGSRCRKTILKQSNLWKERSNSWNQSWERQQLRMNCWKPNCMMSSELKNSVARSTSEMESVIKERNELKESLDQTKELLYQAEKVSVQARDKVTDALAMAQDALANEASITEEKARLEDAMAEILTAAEQKLAKEVEKTRKEMEDKVNELQTQLHTLTIEKNRVALENESVKSEYRVRQNQTMDKTKALHHELEELRAKRQSDLVQWHDERDSLRRQVAALQGETESLLAQLRRRQMPCPDCKEQKIQVDRYRKLAKKWEETADSVTQNFEKYLKEAKLAYTAKRPVIPVGKN
ncbi:uncharacterized protein LOC106666224 isoform X4 [Cimex lectularius]|uniref:Uncharacterized protein n=1 Tax=Cimex lectularius TaxID=79782 RepID=A0A8I6SND1_CIMLE|nr:uncharacterized protein LOC106666224 isoform X4 [Cimex lectularius]